MTLETPLLTYTYDRVTEAVTFAGEPSLEVGQWANYLSRGIRDGATPAHRVQLTVGTKLTPASGCVVLYLNPDNDNGGGGQDDFGRVFSWRTDDNNRLSLLYIKGSTQWNFEYHTGGGQDTAVVSDTFGFGDAKVVMCAWDATTIYVAVDGGTIVTFARTQPDATLPASFDVGSVAGSVSYFEAAYGAVHKERRYG